MLIFSDRGPVSFDERNVVACYRGGSDGRYTFVTLALRDGSELSGAIANAALDALEAKLDADLPPQAA